MAFEFENKHWRVSYRFIEICRKKTQFVLGRSSLEGGFGWRCCCALWAQHSQLWLLSSERSHHRVGIFKSSCYIDVRWFPFDVQQCKLKFGSWSYGGWSLDLQMQEADISGYIPNGEWDLVGKLREDMWPTAWEKEACFLCECVEFMILPCSSQGEHVLNPEVSS